MNICPICNKEHDSSYGSGKFCSKHCQYVYIGRQTKNHVCNFHNVKRGNWKCCWCDAIFETKSKLRQHKKINHKNHDVWNKGLTKETDERVKKISQHVHQKIINGQIKFIGHPHTKETKEKLSKIRSEQLDKTLAGFKDVKWYKVKNLHNIQFVVRGTWQLNVALKLNELNILWEKNYCLNYYLNDIKRTYNPDFYIPSYNEYIQVKGYFSEKDKIKMDAVMDQNPEVKIKFIQKQVYEKFIQNKILFIDIPIYKFGEFNSGYIKKGVIKKQKKIKERKNK